MTHKPHCALALGKGNSGPYEIKKNSFDLEFPPQPDRVLGIGMLFQPFRAFRSRWVGAEERPYGSAPLICVLYFVFYFFSSLVKHYIN